MPRGMRMLWVPVLGAILLWLTPPTECALRTLQRGHSYKISPKPCSVNGVEGTCMFVWECIKSEGQHLGMCVDTFMFGSCCAHNDSHNEALPPPQYAPAVLYVPPDSTPATTISTAASHHWSVTADQSGAWSAWQPSTTEPAFVTRPRPRPPIKPTRRPFPFATSSTTTTTTTTSTTTTTTTTTPTPRTTSSSTSTTHRPFTSSTTTSPSLPNTSTFPTALTTSAESKVQCGVPPLFPRPEMRIVGGRNAPFGGWPWQVSVRRTSFFGFSSTHRCGGALLNENWIATAGHCVDDLLTSQIRVRVGEYDFSSVQEPLPFAERGVARKVVHPRYNFFTYEHDLALVRLDKPVDFAPHISPICLPASDDLLIGENATVTGWGRLSEGGTLPSVLQEVSVPIVSNDKCKSMFLRAGRHEFIPEIFLCAGYESGGQDSCQGDSGGPLQVRGKDGHYFLAGIISWGIGCAEANLPGVCTRISKFVPWILENVT